MAIPFDPGAVSVSPTMYNYLAGIELTKPQYADLVIRQHQPWLPDLLVLMGDISQVKSKNPQYLHFEMPWEYPKVKATTAGAAAGASATFALATTSPVQQYPIDQNAPYQATSPTSYDAGVPVREGDVINIRPSASGFSGATNTIQALVQSVNINAGTFTAIPKNSGEAIPAIASAQEIWIIGPSMGEIGGTRRSQVPTPLRYSNNIQYFQDTCEIGDIAAETVLWSEFNGTPYWDSYQTNATQTRMREQTYGTLLYGNNATNVTLASAYAQDPKLFTNGLVPEVLSRGISYAYSSLTGFTLTDIEALTTQLDSEHVGNEWLICAGIKLKMSMSKNLRGEFDNGALIYGTFNAQEDKYANFDFSGFKWGTHTFKIMQCRLNNFAQTTGAQGYDYISEGLVLPLGKMVDTLNNVQRPMLSIHYMGSGLFYSAARDLKVIDGRKGMAIEYYSNSGIQVMGANSAAYIYEV